MENIKRSETVFKKNRDDWVDERGFLHTKITKETITGPINNVQASQPLNNAPLIPGIFNSLFRKRPIVMQQPQQVQPVQPVAQPRQQPMPQIDFVALMNAGKKLMDDMGIDPKELLSDAFKTVSKDEPLEDKVEPLDKSNALIDEKEVNSKWQKKVKRQKPLKSLKTKTNQKIQKKTQNKKSK